MKTWPIPPSGLLCLMFGKYQVMGPELYFRFGIGRFTTDEEVDYTVEHCVRSVKKLREMRSVLYINSVLLHQS